MGFSVWDPGSRVSGLVFGVSGFGLKDLDENRDEQVEQHPVSDDDHRVEVHREACNHNAGYEPFLFVPFVGGF